MPELPPALRRPATLHSWPEAQGLAVGVALLALLVFVDVSTTSALIIAGAFLVPALVSAFFAGPRVTAAIAAAGVAATVASAAWNDNLGDSDWFFRIGLVAVGGVLAFVSALDRMRARERLAQQQLLARVGEIADGTRSLADTLDRLSDLLVPRIADAVVVDSIRDQRTARVGVRASGPHGAEWERLLRADPPAPPEVPGSPAAALAAGKPVLVQSLDEETIDRLAVLPEYRRFLREHPVSSIISVPLRSRGLDLGVMALLVGPSGRRFAPAHVEFVGVLAGRVGLALDNAGLSQELMTTEQQLRAVLANLAEAVIVQDRAGALVFANETAAALLGASSVEELVEMPVAEMLARFESINPDGTPLQPDQLPGARILRGEAVPPVLVRTIDRESGEEAWRLAKTSAIAGPDGDPAFAVSIIEDVTEAKRAERTQRILAEAGRLLGSSLDYHRTVQRLADLVTPELSDWCVVSVPGDDILVPVAVAHSDPGRVEWARRLQERWPTPMDMPTGAPAVIRSGRPEYYPDIPDELLTAAARDDEHLALIRDLGMRSAIIVPVVAGTRTVGALTLVTAESGRRFTRADLELAEELGRRAGTAVENARVFSERSRVAMTLQAGLLPPRLPAMEGWIARSLYRPAGEETQVGGDFYDLFRTAAGWMALIGDVAGRGPAAASLTSMARYTLQTAGTLVGSPAVALGRLNDGLRERGGTALCTAALVVLGENGDGSASATVACAGHPRPLLVRDGTPTEVGATGPLLGAFEDVQWPTRSVDLVQGDILVLYTDGVIDARGETDRFGEHRLIETITGARTADDLIDRLRSALDEFEVEEGRDDTAVLAIMRTG